MGEESPLPSMDDGFFACFVLCVFCVCVRLVGEMNETSLPEAYATLIRVWADDFYRWSSVPSANPNDMIYFRITSVSRKDDRERVRECLSIVREGCPRLVVEESKPIGEVKRIVTESLTTRNAKLIVSPTHLEAFVLTALPKFIKWVIGNFNDHYYRLQKMRGGVPQDRNQLAVPPCPYSFEIYPTVLIELLYSIVTVLCLPRDNTVHLPKMGQSISLETLMDVKVRGLVSKKKRRNYLCC